MAMHAATPSTVSGGSSASIGSGRPLRAHTHHSRSDSLSSSSITTIKRPGSLSSSSASTRSSAAPTRSQSPGAQDEIPRLPRNLSRDLLSQPHKRRRSVGIESLEQQTGELDLHDPDRWSHSTHSSATSLTQQRRKRSSSGAVLSILTSQQFAPKSTSRSALDSSPKASPSKRSVPARTSSLRRTSRPSSPTSSPLQHRRLNDSLTALPPIHTTPALTDPNDTESPSTLTVATPSTQSSSSRHDYFGADESTSPQSLATAKQRPLMIRTGTTPSSGANHYRGHGSDGQATLRKERSGVVSDSEQRPKTAGGPGDHGYRRPRTREKTEKDKKTMLSKALQKANTAVLLDNAQNYEGALEAYSEACDLLQQVMDRTSGGDDKRKLDAIRVTYSNRIEELWQLVQSRPNTAEEKNLPARPMSDDSMASSLISPIGTALSPVGHALSMNDTAISPLDSSTDFTPTASRMKDVPILSHPSKSRHNYYNRPGTAEDRQRINGVHQRNQAVEPAETAANEDQTSTDLSSQRQLRRTSVHLPPPDHNRYMPAPLSPRRPSLPQKVSPVEPVQQPESVSSQTERDSEQDQTESNASVSWLDTIDESASSRASSVHSVSLGGVRRKHIRPTSGDSDPDFDAAFDAAVEAAYDEGLEPDLDARQKRLTAFRDEANASRSLPKSHVRETVPAAVHQPTSSLDYHSDDEEEERILDSITQDYSQGFNFDLRSKSALPRQSDSSGYSGTTWQSSQASTDRGTATSSLTTVAEDGLIAQISKNTGSRLTSPTQMDKSVLPPPTAPPSGALPRPPNAGPKSVRNRRLSGQSPKPLKIETVTKSEPRKRASTFHNTRSPFAEEGEEQPIPEIDRRFRDDARGDEKAPPTPSLQLHSVSKDDNRPTTATAVAGFRPSYEADPADARGARPVLFRKNKSSISLREPTEHTILLASPDLEPSPMAMTPMSSTFMTFAAKRHQNSLTSQRATLPSFNQSGPDGQNAGGVYLFDTSLSVAQIPLSPRTPMSPNPASLEPCPESFLLRPFWLMRALSATLTHPRGGFVTTKVFVPREVWQTKGVKLKLVEDKVAQCDLLTAALGRLSGVDTYDADAVMEELQSFEEVMERVQAALTKKLGSDVGVQGAAGMFKDAHAAATAPGGFTMGSDSASGHDKSAKSNSGKSYLTSWRKLRNKSSGAPLSGMHHMGKTSDKDQYSIPSVPMTNYVPVERRGNKRDPRNCVFEGPHREYMESLSRLFESVQILDQIARQVEDPGLRHSSPTHVGLELSIRHAAEFFGFYLCRFVLTDLGTLIDKFVKRGTEWVLA